MRGHLDRIAAALAAARAAGVAAGAPQGGLGYGAAWPAPAAAGKAAKTTSRRTKATVRNAERPETPTHPPPGADEAVHRAAALLQRLLRGRAIQADMQAALAARAALIDELMTPLAEGACPLAPASLDGPGAAAAAMVGAVARKLLQYGLISCHIYHIARVRPEEMLVSA